MNRFTKLDSTGADLPDDAPEWSFIRDNNIYIIDGECRQLIWSRAESADRYAHAEAIAHAATIDICGAPGRLPTVDELQTIADRSRIDPAIDTRYFDSNGRWVWSSTGEASGPGYAWYVYFSGGGVYCYPRSGSGFVRAVRAVPPSQ